MGPDLRGGAVPVQVEALAEAAELLEGWGVHVPEPALAGSVSASIVAPECHIRRGPLVLV
ncbi:MAG TPA: hypothetical protein G4O20_04140 [Dehalococcoidia bacterium]|nr:hypothetical protein [Dehalococcoidia bacterium]